ncbi:MAG: NAD(+) synthase [Lacipirellulaceae bacterium]
MTRTLRLGAASLNQTPVDWTGNRLRAVAAIEAARDAGVGLLCLPELAVSAYGCEDLYYAPHVRQRSLAELALLLPATKRIAVAIGLAVECDGALYNAAAMIADGALLGFYCKQFLADDGIHYEPRWFKPWPAGEAREVEFAGRNVPIGDVMFELGGLRVGFEVCRDAWVADRPACRMAARGVHVALNPSASHFALGKQAIREGLATRGAGLVGGAYAYANLLGCEAGRAIFDGGTLIATAKPGFEGRLVAAGERFSFADHSLVWSDVEVNERPPATEDIPVITHPFDPVAASGRVAATPPPFPAARWEVGPHLRHEEVARALAIGVGDYLRKSGARGFVLSLSGGADSAACAALVWIMVKLAGPLLSRRLPTVGDATTAEEAVGRLLTTVYQSTRNSSDVTRNAARAVAEAVGAEHREWSIDDLVERYTAIVGDAIGRELSWKTDDVTLQNVQARVRSPGVWMLANLKNSLLLATGNRSEASVGYCTMDGDTSGGLAPIAGLDKATLRVWLRWLEATGPEGVGPLASLGAVNAQAPTAELRPLAEHQTDERDLMPYPVLDAIERSLVARLEGHDTALATITKRFPEHTPERLGAWLERFERLWRASQWKRERLAPSFHLDTHSVDPKTFRRWPILSAPPWDAT